MVTRVALAVSPRLLADSLASLLAGEDMEVVPVDETEHVDVVLTTSSEPVPTAEVTIELDNGPHGMALGTVRGSTGGPEVRLEGLVAILDFVRGWPADRLEHPHGQR